MSAPHDNTSERLSVHRPHHSTTDRHDRCSTWLIVHQREFTEAATTVKPKHLLPGSRVTCICLSCSFENVEHARFDDVEVVAVVALANDVITWRHLALEHRINDATHQSIAEIPASKRSDISIIIDTIGVPYNNKSMLCIANERIKVQTIKYSST